MAELSTRQIAETNNATGMDENKVAAGAGAVFWLVPPDFQADGGMAAYVDFTRPACDALQGRRQASGRSLGPGSRGYRESRDGDGFQQIPGEAFKSRLSEFGMSEAMAQAMLDMTAAKNEGLDNANRALGDPAPRLACGCWCEEVLKPTVLSG